MSINHDTEKYNLTNAPLNKVQKCAVKLMQNDLRLFFTLLCNQEIVTPSYYIALMPYTGLIVDGIEDWVNAYNNSSKYKLKLPTFTDEEEKYYTEMRNSIKLFEKGYIELNKTLYKKYEQSETYFSSLCKPIAKRLHLYDIYGTFYCNSLPCDNTILNQVVTPFFIYGKIDGETIKQMAAIGREYTVCFNALQPYKVKSDYNFSAKDYGGLVKSPFGNKYNYKFLLFTILCQINFIVYSVDKFIVDETSTKLRFAYILYYYLLSLLPDIKENLKISIIMDDKYHSDIFRNAMAHYKLGVSLKENDIIDDDPMFGLTNKIFSEDYYTVKSNIISELDKAGKQIQSIINLK